MEHIIDIWCSFGRVLSLCKFQAKHSISFSNEQREKKILQTRVDINTYTITYVICTTTYTVKYTFMCERCMYLFVGTFDFALIAKNIFFSLFFGYSFLYLLFWSNLHYIRRTQQRVQLFNSFVDYMCTQDHHHHHLHQRNEKKMNIFRLIAVIRHFRCLYSCVYYIHSLFCNEV